MLVVTGLIAAGTPMDAVWAFELRNEQFFEADQPPFGVLDSATTANGETYDLSDPAQVHAMRDAGLRHFADRMVATIKEVDPTALVTMGFFPSAEGPVEVPPDARLVDYGQTVLEQQVVRCVWDGQNRLRESIELLDIA